MDEMIKDPVMDSSERLFLLYPKDKKITPEMVVQELREARQPLLREIKKLNARAQELEDKLGGMIYEHVLLSLKTNSISQLHKGWWLIDDKYFTENVKLVEERDKLKEQLDAIKKDGTI